MKYLIAVDGSKASESAVKYAASLFQNMKGENHITVITVQDNSALKMFKKFTPKGAVDDYLREGADTNLAWTVRFLSKANVAHDMSIKFGHPSEQILKEAKAGGFDMIIMGTKGRSGWADTVLGSVAQRVAGASKVPVLLIKP
jgi:nucleotide-binding universal stress UspA family protein